MDLKSFDWRSLQKYLAPSAANDLNDFLEKLPHTAGHYALIAAGIAWTAAAALGLYTAVKTQSLIELRAELKETKALAPLVPSLRDVPVRKAEVDGFAAVLTKTYPGLDIKQQGPSIQITDKTTSMYGVWREAIGHVQNGGAGWRVNVDKLCVGRECKGRGLGVLLKINKVSVDMPKS